MRKFEYVPDVFTTTSKLTPPLLSHLLYMDISVIQQNHRINPEIITSYAVILRHVCINIMNTDDS